MTRVLSLYLPSWAIDRVRRRWPAWRRVEPLALWVERGGSQVVSACSREAWSAGLREGMSLSQARATCPGLAAERHDARADAAALASLARWLLRLAPRAGVDGADGLLLDVTGCARLYGGEGRLRSAVLGAVRGAGFAAAGAIAGTIGAAWAAARAAAAGLMEEDDCIIDTGRTAAALARLPPWALRLEGPTAAHLAALGVDRIETLLMLPRSSLPSRFGEGVLLRMDQALGYVAEDFAAVEPSREISAAMRFEYAVNRAAAVDLAVQRLVEQVASGLEAAGAGALRLDLAFFGPGGSGAVWRRSVSLCRPSQDRRHLLGLLRIQYERLDLSPGVGGLRLTAGATRPIDVRSGALFGEADGSAAAWPEAAALLDELAGRLGDGRVVQARLKASLRPEEGWVEGGNVETSKRQNVETSEGRNIEAADGLDEVGVLRPLRLLGRPELIEVMALEPDSPPAWFRHLGREHRVRWGVGPERMCGAWWSGPDEGAGADGSAGIRDYYQVESEGGCRFWVYCERASRRWYLHGVYE